MTYFYSLLRFYTWQDMILKPRYFFGMCGVKGIIKHFVSDTWTDRPRWWAFNGEYWGRISLLSILIGIHSKEKIKFGRLPL